LIDRPQQASEFRYLVLGLWGQREVKFVAQPCVKFEAVNKNLEKQKILEKKLQKGACGRM